MKTNGFVVHSAKFIKTTRSSTMFHGGKKFTIETPTGVGFKLDSVDNRNVHVSMSRQEAMKLAKALLKETKIKRRLRKK